MPATGPSTADFERAAAEENGWVRARILKNDPPAEGSLLKISERAQRMAAESLGEQHWAHGAALLNLGIYYDFIEHDAPKAMDFIGRARAILQDTETGRGMFSDALYQLGTARKERNRSEDDPKTTEAYLSESLAVERKLSADRLAYNEAQQSGPWMDRLDEVCAYHSRDLEAAAANPAASGWEEGFADGLDMIVGIFTNHRDYLQSYGAAPWGGAPTPEVRERLAAYAPMNVAWLGRLADAYQTIADAQGGDPYYGALPSYQTALFFCERLLAADGSNAEWQQRAIALRKTIDDLATRKPL